MKKTAKVICLIEPEQLAAAKAEGKAQGVSMAEVIRRALAAYLATQQRLAKRQERKAHRQEQRNRTSTMLRNVTMDMMDVDTEAAPKKPEGDDNAE